MSLYLRRKFVSSQDYELRCYIYAARALPRLGAQPPNPAVRVSCAGVTRQTVPQLETSTPVFMECLRLNCRLAVRSVMMLLHILYSSSATCSRCTLISDRLTRL